VTALPDVERYEERRMDVLTRSVITQFEQYVKLNKKVAAGDPHLVAASEQAGRWRIRSPAHMSLSSPRNSEFWKSRRAQAPEHMLAVIEGEMDVLQIEKRIRGRVKQQMEKSQREYYLNEQMKAIQRNSASSTMRRTKSANWKSASKRGHAKEAREKRIPSSPNSSSCRPCRPEATVVRNYIDWLVKSPWKSASKVHSRSPPRKKVLEADHYGWKRSRTHRRVLGRAATGQDLRGPILCLVGRRRRQRPRGSKRGARHHRKFVRMSLGGVRDEAEIRGHRRTYIGSCRQDHSESRQCGVRNPLFLLDEVDKMSTDFRGDPSSALLEGTGPRAEQHLHDHYLEVDFDLSEVMSCARRIAWNIPAPLLDRMEVIRLPGYTEDEKSNIARRYLLPKQVKQERA